MYGYEKIDQPKYKQPDIFETCVHFTCCKISKNCPVKAKDDANKELKNDNR